MPSPGLVNAVDFLFLFFETTSISSACAAGSGVGDPRKRSRERDLDVLAPRSCVDCVWSRFDDDVTGAANLPLLLTGFLRLNVSLGNTLIGVNVWVGRGDVSGSPGALAEEEGTGVLSSVCLPNRLERKFMLLIASAEAHSSGDCYIVD